MTPQRGDELLLDGTICVKVLRVLVAHQGAEWVEAGRYGEGRDE
jgi:hypothetical protein